MYSEKWDEASVNPWCGEIYRLRSSHTVLRGFEACVCDCTGLRGPEMGKKRAAVKDGVSRVLSVSMEGGRAKFSTVWPKVIPTIALFDTTPHVLSRPIFLAVC